MAIGALSLVALLASASLAQSWTSADPAGALDDDSPEAAAVLRFSDQLQNRGLHQVCDKLPMSGDYSDNERLVDSRKNGDNGELAGGAAGGGRQLHRYPNGELALIDSVEAELSLGYSKKLLHSAGPSPLSLIFGSDFQGRSMVARP